MTTLPLADFHLAACKGLDTNRFVGTNTTTHARRVCAKCPIETDCLEWAMNDPTLHGIWGGTSKTERDAERHRRGLDKPPAPAAPQPVAVKLCDTCNQPLEGKERHGRRHQACACGTPSGPNWHSKRREPLCAKCSAWNAARLRRVRRTGSSTVAA